MADEMIRRLVQFFRALLHARLSKLEERGEVAQLQLATARAEFDAADAQLGQAIADERQLGLRVRDEVKEASDWKGRAEAAMTINHEDLARRALELWYEHAQTASRLDGERQAQAEHVSTLRLELERSRHGFDQEDRSLTLLAAREHMAKGRGILGRGGEPGRALPAYEHRVMALESRNETKGESTAQEIDRLTGAVEREAVIERELARLHEQIRPKAVG